MTSPLSMVTSIEMVEFATVLPDTSWTVTTGWVLNSVRLTKPVGSVVSASLVAAP